MTDRDTTSAEEESIGDVRPATLPIRVLLADDHSVVREGPGEWLGLAV
jgi:hypothetical protein